MTRPNGDERSLHDVLAALGWRSDKPDDVRGPSRRRIYDETGAEVGDYTAGECWELLRQEGLI